MFTPKKGERLDRDFDGFEPMWDEPKATKPINHGLNKYVPLFPGRQKSLSEIADPAQGHRRRPRPWFVIIATCYECGVGTDSHWHDKLCSEGISDSGWPIPKLRPLRDDESEFDGRRLGPQ